MRRITLAVIAAVSLISSHTELVDAGWKFWKHRGCSGCAAPVVVGCHAPVFSCGAPMSYSCTGPGCSMPSCSMPMYSVPGCYGPQFVAPSCYSPSCGTPAFYVQPGCYAPPSCAMSMPTYGCSGCSQPVFSCSRPGCSGIPYMTPAACSQPGFGAWGCQQPAPVCGYPTSGCSIPSCAAPFMDGGSFGFQGVGSAPYGNAPLMTASEFAPDYHSPVNAMLSPIPPAPPAEDIVW